MRAFPGPEFELLLRCARLQIDEEHAGRISALAAGDLDWERFVVAARSHGLVPLVYRTLGGMGSGQVPEAILAKLKSLSEAIRFHNLVKAKELIVASRALEAAGVTAMPYKGPALAAFLYGDLGLRQFGDVDLLVRPRDAIKARNALLGQGYIPYRRISAPWEAIWVRVHQEFLLVVPEKRFVVDLSWRFALGMWCLPEITDSVWERLGHLSLLGASLRWPQPEHLLLILCLHGSKHRWEELKWVVDVAELLRTRPDLDWDKLTAEARRMGAYRMLAIGVLLASELLDAPIPASLLAELRSAPRVARLAAEVCDDLCVSTAKPAAVADRLSEIQGRLSFLSRAADRSATRWACRVLSPGYFVLYRVVRPGAAVLKRVFAG